MIDTPQKDLSITLYMALMDEIRQAKLKGYEIGFKDGYKQGKEEPRV
jgi:flagellar biosynthesis/type III secretory pathway protein FliH